MFAEMKSGPFVLLLFALVGCGDPMDTMEGAPRWPKSPKETLEPRDTSCSCLLTNRCTIIDFEEVETGEIGDEGTLSCAWTNRWRGKALCQYRNRRLTRSDPTPWITSSIIVRRYRGRGWCFDKADAAENEKLLAGDGLVPLGLFLSLKKL